MSGDSQGWRGTAEQVAREVLAVHAEGSLEAEKIQTYREYDFDTAAPRFDVFAFAGGKVVEHGDLMALANEVLDKM